jgi:hypothetical protein
LLKHGVKKYVVAYVPGELRTLQNEKLHGSSLAKYYSGVQIREDEMDGAYGTNSIEEKTIQGVVERTEIMWPLRICRLEIRDY